MISLIEADEADVTGNLDSLRKNLTEDVDVESAIETPAEAAKPKVRTIEIIDEELPENLRGKDVRDIVRMYQDSQSTIGRMANDLGTQRKLTDRLLDLKRDEDLQRNGAPAKVQVSGTELLDNPTEAIERVVAARLAAVESKTAEEIATLRAQREAENFMSRHPDFNQIGADPEFQAFVQATPFRQRAAFAASKGDWSSADELITEFKDRRKVVAARKQAEEEEVTDKNLDAANKASLESGTSANSRPTKSGKIYRRVDLLRLQMEKPDEYYDEATQAVIMKAYREGRVR